MVTIRLTQTGFAPAVDVFYARDPPRAIVHAELAGMDASDVEIEVRGRDLVLTGCRPAPAAEGRLYQQVEIEHGRFRRVVALGVEVDGNATTARFEHGILEVVLPLVPEQRRARRIPVQADG